MDEFLYVYTDDDGLIQKVEDELNPSFECFNLCKIAKDKAKNFDEFIGREFKISEKYVLVESNGEYSPVRVILVYYNKEQIIISAKKEKQYDDDDLLKYGYVKFDELIMDFLNGIKGVDLIYYKIEETEQLLSIVKKPESDYLKTCELVDHYRIEFLKQAEIEILYHRKKSILKIKTTNNREKDTWIYFMKKNDSTYFLDSVKFSLDGTDYKFSDVKLPKYFDAYSPISNMKTFSFKVI